MKLLFTSVGRRSYLIKYFKEALKSDDEIHVSNSTCVTPAFMFADKSVVSPLIHENVYIPFMLEYCKKNRIDALISLFDIDLPILAKNKDKFEQQGTRVIISEPSVINICHDKLETYNFLVSNGFNTAKTFTSTSSAIESVKRGEVNYPLIIKPRWGMGSIGMFEAENEFELDVLYKKVLSTIENTYLKFDSKGYLDECVLIQEKLKGHEYGLDIINDLDGSYQNTIIKEKYAMRSGETDCARTVSNSILKKLGDKLSNKLRHIANLDVDVFFYKNTPYILEMNARFGGGYPFSHIAGANLPLAIIKWLREEKIDKNLLKAEIGVIAHKDINIVNLSNTMFAEDENKLIQVESKQEIYNTLIKFDTTFEPRISQRISDFEGYSSKLLDNGYFYIAKKNDEVIGFIAFYANNLNTRVAYLTFIAVKLKHQKGYLGTKLMELCLNKSRECGMRSIKLEVRKSNEQAIKFYKRHGFYETSEASPESIYMIKELRMG